MMEVLNIIDELEDIIDDAAKVPFAGKCMVDKDALLDLIEELRLKLPEDLKQAKWVKDERQRILSEAQKEAEGIIKSAEEKTIAMINEHEITQEARKKAAELVAAAEQRAKDVMRAAGEYCEDAMKRTEEVVGRSLEELKQSHVQFRQVIREQQNND